MGDLLKLPAMRAALITNAIVMVGWDLFNLYMPVYLRNIGFTATTIGYIMGSHGVAVDYTAGDPAHNRALGRASHDRGRAAEGIAMRLAVSCGAHVFIPTAFGALGAAVGLQPIFWLCATALMSGSAMNAKQAGKITWVFVFIDYFMDYF